MGRKPGAVLSWIAAGLTLLLAVLYLLLVISQGAIELGDGWPVLSWVASLLVAAAASAGAAMARRRATAIGLLTLTLLVLLPWIVLGMFSIGLLFLAPAAVAVAAIVQMTRERPSADSVRGGDR